PVTPELLTDIVNAAKSEKIKELPSEHQAAAYFEKLVNWRPNTKAVSMFGFGQNNERLLAALVGEALGRSVVPALSSIGRTEERFHKLCAFYSEVTAPEALMALPYFAITDKSFIEPVERLIRQALQSDDANKLAYSSYSLLIWRDQGESPAADRLIMRLIYLVGVTRMTGSPALLWTANQMYRKKYLSRESTELLLEILPIIFDNTNYKNISPSARESVSVSFVRAACVRLARDMISGGERQNQELFRILEEAKHDALPEVRFAEETDI
ncbi:SIR2 family protein, partial [Pseudomonas syringae]